MASDATFETFAVSTAPMLFRTAWMLCHDRHTSEDLVQETLAKVYVKWRDRSEIENPAGYARTTLVRLHISRQRRRQASEVVADDLEPTGADPDPTITLTLHRALAELGPLDRAVLVLRYLHDLPVVEVAHDLRLTESAVRTRTSRAMRKLRDRLGADFLVLSR